jgi:glucose/arabinose dehydrogenase
MRALMLLLSLLLAGPAIAQPVRLAAKLVVDGLSQPVFVTAPKGDPRLFVVEKTGTIRIIVDGKVGETPFLDISGKVSGGSEQGLLGLAFHPDFASNGRFFIDYTDRAGDTHVTAYTVAPDATQVNAGSGKDLLTIDQPYANHNGGFVGFGPDGLLYISTGDGGSGGDPHGNGQTTNELHGKILRIDVDHAEPYAIPASNPFANGGGAKEVFAYGLRNPWRIAFDGNDIYIADVGQNRWEEVDVIATSDAGANLGWNVMEGERCFAQQGCDPGGMVKPVHVYSHDEGCSITGGYVYRGQAIPEIVGDYFFADYCSGKVWSFKLADGNAGALTDWTEMLSTPQISSFGMDDAGEMYMTTLDGELYQIARGE